MNLPPLFLRYAQGGPWLVLLIVILLALWGLAEMHDRQRQLAEDFCGGLVREEEWLQQLATSQRRIEERASIAQAVVEDRLPLAEAAAQFRQRDRARDGLTKADRDTPGRGVEAASCRAVIDYIANQLDLHPEWIEVLPRLERELDQHLAKLDQRGRTNHP